MTEPLEPMAEHLAGIGTAARPVKAGDLDFLDFGCGAGRSMEYASSIFDGHGLGIDIAPKAVDACRAKNYAVEQGDMLTFEQRNVATASFAINVMQELPGHNAFERAMMNIIRASRNFTMVQHNYFDEDTALGLAGYQVEGNVGKKISCKPTSADYISFVSRYQDTLNLVGMAIFTFGHVAAKPLNMSRLIFPELAEGANVVHQSVRVVLARKNVARFRDALKKVGTGKALFIWEGD
jgi:trans-aconitate methyltransferase